jgi:hypothetical protein
MPAVTNTTRVNFDLPTPTYQEVQGFSGASGLTMKDLFMAAFALLQQVHTAQAAGGSLVLVTSEGQRKLVVLPSKTVQVIDPAAVMSPVSPAPAT